MTMIYGEALAVQIHAGFSGIQSSLVNISGGTFTMGDVSIPDASPAHEVTLDPFLVGKTLVTYAQYGRWEQGLGTSRFFLLRPDIKTGAYTVAARGENRGELDDAPVLSGIRTKRDLTSVESLLLVITIKAYSLDRSPNAPVSVNWWSALIYAQMHGGDLPTEAQREFVARTQSMNIECMRGVREWCGDWHGPYVAGPQINPTGPITGRSRVVREGAKNSTHPALRDYNTPNFYGKASGFRLMVP